MKTLVLVTLELYNNKNNLHLIVVEDTSDKLAVVYKAS